MMNEEALALEAIGKSFSGVRVLRDVNLSLRRGEARALVGENGAGKSTLIKIIAGVHRPDTGRILLGGVERRFRRPLDAYRAGVAVVHQETSLVPTATVLQNVFLGREAVRGFGVLDERRMRRELDSVCARLGVSLPHDRKVRDLGAAEKKLVEIMKAFARDSSLLILDEPTDSLSHDEIRGLFRVLGDLRARGMTIIYITHFLGEVADVADSATVLRDGAVVTTLSSAQVSTPELVALMLGRQPPPPEPLSAPAAPGEPVLSVRDLARRGEFSGVSFDLRRGEVLGIVGVVGSGKTELARTLSGACRPHHGEIRLLGRSLHARSPRQAVRAGVGMAPEDRKTQGLILEHEVYKNITLTSLGRFSRAGLIHGGAERAAAEATARSVSVKYASLFQRMKFLSGGNQQKCVVARWLLAAPLILILDEATRGVDVGAKAEIHAIVRRLAREGRSVLYLTGEAPEVLAVADRVVVMQRGRIRSVHGVPPSEEVLLREMLEVTHERR
jgi:ABC-type sugar transport system ATPase subunit